jgi:hypothetical protein
MTPPPAAAAPWPHIPLPGTRLGGWASGHVVPTMSRRGAEQAVSR